MSTHSEWKDKAIAMKKAGVQSQAIADRLSVSRNAVIYVTRGVKSSVPIRKKARTQRYVEATGFSASHKTRLSVSFPREVFDSINTIARSSNKSFSSAVVELASRALADQSGAS